MAALVWPIEPELRAVAVCRLDRQPQVVEEGEELTGKAMLPGFRCRVADRFLLPGEKARAARTTPQGEAQS